MTTVVLKCLYINNTHWTCSPLPTNECNKYSDYTAKTSFQTPGSALFQNFDCIGSFTQILKYPLPPLTFRVCFLPEDPAISKVAQFLIKNLNLVLFH